MGFVTQPLRFGDGEKAFVDLPWDEAGGGRNDNRAASGRAAFQFTATLRPIPSDQILAPTIVARRPWNRGRVVWVEAEVGIGRHGESKPRDSGPGDIICEGRGFWDAAALLPL